MSDQHRPLPPYLPLSRAAKALAQRGSPTVNLEGVSPFLQDLHYLRLEDIKVPSAGVLEDLVGGFFTPEHLAAVDIVQILPSDNPAKCNANVWFACEDALSKAIAKSQHKFDKARIQVTRCVHRAQEPLDGMPELFSLVRNSAGVVTPRVRVGPIPLKEGFVPPQSFKNLNIRPHFHEYEFETPLEAVTYFDLDVTWSGGVKCLLTARQVRPPFPDVFNKTIIPALKVEIQTKRAASPSPTDSVDSKKPKTTSACPSIVPCDPTSSLPISSSHHLPQSDPSSSKESFPPTTPSSGENINPTSSSATPASPQRVKSLTQEAPPKPTSKSPTHSPSTPVNKPTANTPIPERSSSSPTQEQKPSDARKSSPELSALLQIVKVEKKEDVDTARENVDGKMKDDKDVDVEAGTQKLDEKDGGIEAEIEKKVEEKNAEVEAEIEAELEKEGEEKDAISKNGGRGCSSGEV